jgi:hypothetical protein
MTDEERQRGTQDATMKGRRKPEEVARVDHFSFVTGNTIVIGSGAVIS